ncbi:tol-pal system protein YbgF [Tardiphaga sp.]|uniref:tol-pal system protein YbgF n=1 Tax=Tardiphaga sp. TaxID=1926292 RepID=UPI0026172181|nr:tol-pal system protein YbgF [Tardiphaga sp.]
MSATLAIPALTVPSVVFAQMQQSDDDVDPEVRVQQLEAKLRQLTGQNEELQFRNRQLEEQLRQLQAAAPPAGARPNVAAAPVQAPVQTAPVGRQSAPPQVYDQQIAAPAPIVQDPAPQRGGRRNDAFDPNANPGAPGVPRALGGGAQPMPANAPAAMPNARGAGEPLPLANSAPAAGGLTTLPPGATPKDEFDLGIGYMQRRDYALAEETMRNFAQKYPTDPQLADSQYWLGESFFQRQRYRDAAEAFLGVTTKFDTSAKAPDALLRLGQSLAALKEKEAACAAFGEVLRKYPRASGGVKTAVDREQKRVKC